MYRPMCYWCNKPRSWSQQTTSGKSCNVFMALNGSGWDRWEYSQQSTRSGSATHCRSSAGRYWQFQGAPTLDSGLCGRWGCGWRKSGDTKPAGAACPSRRSYCILTTLQYPSCSGENHKSLVLGRYPQNTHFNIRWLFEKKSVNKVHYYTVSNLCVWLESFPSVHKCENRGVDSHKAGQGWTLQASSCGVGLLLLSHKASDTWTWFSRETQWKMEYLNPEKHTS